MTIGIIFFVFALVAVACATLASRKEPLANEAKFDPYACTNYAEELEKKLASLKEIIETENKHYQEVVLPERFRVWAKHTSNPGNLTFEEWKTLKKLS